MNQQRVRAGIEPTPIGVVQRLCPELASEISRIVGPDRQTARTEPSRAVEAPAHSRCVTVLALTLAATAVVAVLIWFI